MNKERLQELAGIVEAVGSPSDSWSQFSDAAENLTKVLQRVRVAAGSPEQRGHASLNFEQINDIQFTVEKLQKQLDRLNSVYQWRSYMKKKKSSK